MAMAWKPRTLGQSHNGGATARFVVSKEATLDAGIVNLYTEEFYALAKRRMRPGAMLVQ